MKDAQGNELTPEQLRKILRSTHYQFRWWKAKSKPPIGEGKPPRGVRMGKEIKRL